MSIYGQIGAIGSRIQEGGISVTARKSSKKTGRVSLRSPQQRDIAVRLATLGYMKVKKGTALNVRRREKVRRALADAGETLRWAEVMATSEDPVGTVTADVKHIVRGGVRALKREVAEELAEKEAEESQLVAIVETVQELAEDPDAEYPTEITYSRTAKDAAAGLVTKTETLSLGDAEEALKAVQKIERSMPRWTKLREEMVDELCQKQARLGEMSRNLSELVDSWRRLLKEVLVTVQ